MSSPALWVQLLDSVVGIFMWLLILQTLLTLILPDNSRFRPLRFLKRVTGPILFIARYATPTFIIDRLKPLIAAFWLFIIRFYILPTALSYTVYRFSDMPFEAFILRVSIAIADKF